MSSTEPTYCDVLIVGAGISGIGAAYRIHGKNPALSYTILEQRPRLGGTWDLFRYPGVRSDSDIFTLSFPFEPWRREETIADGSDIWRYLDDTARKHHIDEHIAFNTCVESADWDSQTDTWTVRAQQNGVEKTYRCRFLFFGTGYYNYDHPHSADLPGIEHFGGVVAHPQHWPESLDYTGKRVVVIGSGATAISMIPTVAAKAAHVTMLQRSPSYLFSMPRIEPMARVMQKVLPEKVAHSIIRWRNALFFWSMFLLARKLPRVMKWVIRQRAIRNLPEGYDVDTHFKPLYNPWDQRMCVILNSDLYKSISDGRVEVVTDHIDHIDAAGIVLRSGRRLDADVIVTATGLRLQALGGISVSVDGEKIDPADRFVYKEHMLEDLPNMAWCIGYTNNSWTLRADMTARSVAKLLSYMDSHGYTHAYPHRGGKPLAEKPLWDLQAGYVRRAAHVLPKSSTHRPWHVRHNYVLDAIDHRFDRIEESMVFGRAAIGSAAADRSRAVG
ncbi:FAD-dependent oxidoreductase [Mycobacterium sp. ACS1612]|uniref:flavin-containing monooxygenase n=1 Tax=Mycobacterium sp. ACS1612 TaxID=1834117 RepID=UPI0007FB9B76|nr:NAD(P)/FAD-dependent oxidoreductase [Mycobacterium sp. ACS1612]OBF29404.1 FAD-dependent oxidoreductase [Mycobacterium sp. ACS1612]